MARSTKPQPYIGINNETNGGMSDSAKVIRDAWAFGIIPETETCEGWLPAGIEDLWRQNEAQWEKCGFRVSGMPPEVKERFLRIQDAAFKQAREQGWEPE